MLDGLRKLLQQRKLPVGGRLSHQAKERFKVQNDPISEFVETECVLGAACEIVKIQLHDAFARFCQGHGIPPYNEASFFRELYSRRLSLKSVRGGSAGSRVQKVKGIDLRED